MIFLALAFLWYVYASLGASFSSLVEFGVFMYQGILTQLFNASARPLAVQEAFGAGILPGLLHNLNRLVQYSVQFFILVGVLWLWRNRKSRVFGYTFVLFTLIALLALILSVVLPNFAVALNLSRVYHLALIFLAPACIAGGMIVLQMGYENYNTVRSNPARLACSRTFSTRHQFHSSICHHCYVFPVQCRIHVGNRRGSTNINRTKLQQYAL